MKKVWNRNLPYCTTCAQHRVRSPIWACAQLRGGQCRPCFEWNLKNLADPTKKQIETWAKIEKGTR